MMRRLSAVLILALLASCAVPQHRDQREAEKAAIGRGQVDEVVERYSAVRRTASGLLDSKPLSIIETGPALAIDAGSFEVSQRLAQRGGAGGDDPQVVNFFTPTFTQYPLWFVAVVDDASDVRKVQVYQRDSAIAPWLVIESPEILADTVLPAIRQSSGQALKVDPDSGVGLAMSPQDAADAYAKALEDEDSPEADQVLDDSFIQQMRAAAASHASLDEVTFAQAWKTRPVEHVLRTSDGGALAFVTLERRDTYEVPAGLTVTWPDGSPQKAFLSSGISGSGELKFLHQILLYVPPGDDKPLALGQFGGVVSAEGDQP